jgi:hypothetical protein
MNDIQIPGLQEVEQSQVLDPAELRRLESLAPELQHAFCTRTIFRTPTEARFSVLNDLKHPTPASKYHQAKLEQAVMFDNLIKLSFAFRRAKIDLDDARARMKKASGRQKERLKVDMDELTYRLICMQKEAQERLRELEMWSSIKASLEGDFDRDNKDTDELLALAKRYTLELPVALRSVADVGGAVNVIAQAKTLMAECKRRNLSILDDQNREEGR